MNKFGDVIVQHSRTRTWMLLPITALLAGLILVCSFRYLEYSDPHGRADIIVLFVGPNQGEDLRLKEALELLREGFADYLFVPDTVGLSRAGARRGDVIGARFSDVKPGASLLMPRRDRESAPAYFQKIRKAYGIPCFYEDTHAEVLLAKKAMDACGFRKAILVSSPYHMRRIKIVSGRVFDPSYDIRLVPTRFGKRIDGLPLAWREPGYCLAEFPKIIWFLSYDLLDRWSRAAGS